MTDISGIGALTGASPASATPAPKTTGNSELGSDTFLQLLVAQLKYQDPTSPADSTQFLAQTAQFTQVEKLTKLAEQSEASFQMNQNMSAASLVGREIQWINDDGLYETGVVDAARLGSAGAVLMVGAREVPFNTVAVVARPSSTSSLS